MFMVKSKLLGLVVCSCTLGGCTLDSQWGKKATPEEETPKTELEGSIANAQKSFDYFETKVRKGQGQNFSAKLILSVKDKQDAVWVCNVKRIRPNQFVGYVSAGQVPLTGHAKGHRIDFTKRQVVDWKFTDGGITFGGFTEPASKPAQVATIKQP